MGDFRIRRAAVLGAGTMGSRIAGHLANAGIPCLLLDIAPAELTPDEAAKRLSLDSHAVRNRIVQAGWKAALNSKPPALFAPGVSSMVTTGNFPDSLESIKDADWILEAVTERLDVKRGLLEQVQRLRSPHSIVSSNTSGIPIRQIAADFPEDFRRSFLGTHFFNPPRYMRLLELVPTGDTDPALVAFMRKFGEERLGKGVVLCKDTPNFIANRIGIHGACKAMQGMVREGFTVEEADALTGPLIGRPKSATFRTADVVGLDTFALVARNLYEALPDDPGRKAYILPDFVETMLQNRMLGEKTRRGFYQRLKDGQIQFLDHRTMEYRPLEKPVFPEIAAAVKIEHPGKRLRSLVSGNGRVQRFLWDVLSSTMTYAAETQPEIADDIVSVDNAMKWGFLHQLGPFETWDVLGPKAAAERLRSEGRSIPPLVEGLLGTGKNSFYRKRSGRMYFFQAASGSYAAAVDGPLTLGSVKERGKTVLDNPAAALLDLGDGVACLEFRSKMNTIGADVLRAVNDSLDVVARGFDGLVIANEGENFSAGANLVEALGAARNSQWDAIEAAVRNFQNVNMRLRYSDKPVVAAPHNMTLGGACEMTLHADLIHASAELYMGFVETGVGLIPAAGGCKEMLLRASESAASDSDTDLMPELRKAFEMIALAKVSGSALEARSMGLLRERDHFSMNPARRIESAKQDVLSLVREGYRPPVPRDDIPVLGQPGLATLKLALHLMHRAGYISDYDKIIGTQLARVLTGGCFLGVHRVSEQHLLDLEREAFLSLCGRPETQQRMEHMLKTGKPLRN